MTVFYLYNRILYRNNKEQLTDTCRNIDGLTDVKLSIRSQAQECVAYEFQEQTKLTDSERIPFCWWMGVLMT